MLLKFVATTRIGARNIRCARKCVFQLVSDTIDSIESMQLSAMYNEFDVILFSLLSFCDTTMQIHTIRAYVRLYFVLRIYFFCCCCCSRLSLFLFLFLQFRLFGVFIVNFAVGEVFSACFEMSVRSEVIPYVCATP